MKGKRAIENEDISSNIAFNLNPNNKHIFKIKSLNSPKIDY